MTRRSTAKKIDNPTDELEAAIAASAAARAELDRAQADFTAKYPGDIRLWLNGLREFTIETTLATPQLEAKQRAIQKATFNDDYSGLAALRQTVTMADRAVAEIQSQRASAISEEERRAELRSAIGSLSATEAQAQGHRDSVGRARAAVAEAENAHRAAVGALEQATEERDRLYEQALEQGHPPGRDSSVSDARRAVEDALDQVTAARKAADALAAKLSASESRAREVRTEVARCARAVAAAALPALLEATIRLNIELEAHRQVLRYLDVSNDYSDVDAYLERSPLEYEQSGAAPEDHPAVEPWLAALQSLLIDADALLPGPLPGSGGDVS